MESPPRPFAFSFRRGGYRTTATVHAVPEIRGFRGTTPVPIDAAASALLLFFLEGASSNCAEYGLYTFEHAPDHIAAALLLPVSFPSGYTMLGHFKLSFWHYYV